MTLAPMTTRTISAAEALRRLEVSPACYQPIDLLFARGLAHMHVALPDPNPFVVPSFDERPTVSILGDAIPDVPSVGPGGWDTLSLRRLLKSCCAVSLVIVEEDDNRAVAPYLAAATACARQGQNIAIVETRSAFAAAWAKLLQSIKGRPVKGAGLRGRL